MRSADSSKAKGVLCIVASAFGFALMAFFVRLCDDFGGPVSCFQKGFFRNFVALVIALCVFVRTVREGGGITRGEAELAKQVARGVRLPAKSAYPTLLARCLFGSFGIFANFYAISHIQVGEAMALNKTAPFFTVLFSWLLLGEKANRRQIVCLVLAFAGAMLVMKPGVRTGDMMAAALGLASGLGAGIAYTCVHKLGRMKVAGSFIVLAFSAFSCLVSVPFAIADFRPMTLLQVLILLGAGAGAALGQFAVTAAYRLAEPRAIAAYDYMGVVFSAMFGFAFFGQVPDWASVAGFVVILLCALWLRR